jgi:hypothetical protein
MARERAATERGAVALARSITVLAVIGLTVALAGAGCKKREPAAAVPAGKPLASKPFYRVDAGPPSRCASGAACEATLVLTALGDYHVNKEYPFKFVGEAAPAPALDGDGAFALGDAKHGTMTVKFKPAAAGTTTVSGTFKLSVCSEDTCEIETPKIELAVPVS